MIKIARVMLAATALWAGASAASAQHVYQYIDTFNVGPQQTPYAVYLGGALGMQSTTPTYYFGGAGLTFYSGDGAIGGYGDYGGDLQTDNAPAPPIEGFHTVTPNNSPYGVQIYTNSFPTGDAYATVQFSIDNALYTGVAHFDTNDHNSDNTARLLDVSYDAVATDVPEPASWTMMVLGFGAVGITARHRKTARATA